MALEIKFEGSEAHEVGLEWKKLFEEMTMSDLELKDDHNAFTPLESDPLAIAAFILSIPGAVVATLNLVDRFRLVEKIEKLLDRIKTSQCSATLLSKNGEKLDLNIANAEEVIDRFG